jgi:hypothetical protein
LPTPIGKQRADRFKCAKVGFHAALQGGVGPGGADLGAQDAEHDSRLPQADQHRRHRRPRQNLHQRPGFLRRPRQRGQLDDIGAFALRLGVDVRDVGRRLVAVGVGDDALAGWELTDLVGHVQLDLDVVGLADDALAQERQAFVFGAVPQAAVARPAAADDDRLGLNREQLAHVRRLAEAVQPHFQQVAAAGGVEHVCQRQPARFLHNRDADHRQSSRG